MGLIELIDEMQDELEHSKTGMFSSKIAVDKDLFLEIIGDMRREFPKEIEEASDILQRRDSIIAEAKKEAEQIVERANEAAKKAVDEQQVLQAAYAKAENIMEKAQTSSKQIRANAEQYAAEILDDIEGYCQEYIAIIARNRAKLSHAKPRDLESEVMMEEESYFDNSEDLTLE